MRSMTGMGVGRARSEGLALGAEIRSVNHRFLDIVFKLPSPLSSLEPLMRQRIGNAIERGRLSVGLELEIARQEYQLSVNDAFVTAYVKRARDLAKRYELDGKLDVAHVLSLPEAVNVSGRQVPEKELRALLEEALDQALERFNAMREKEGRALAKELSKRSRAVAKELKKVVKLADEVPKSLRRRLEDRLARFGAADAVDPQRLASEVALMVDRATISEECERLASHLKQFGDTLGTTGPVAKRLGFLLQEMHREVNTMGSKSTHLAITNCVVRMKEEIENMREQIQNLE